MFTKNSILKCSIGFILVLIAGFVIGRMWNGGSNKVGAAPVSGIDTNLNNLALGIPDINTGVNGTTTGTLTLNNLSDVVSQATCGDATGTIFAILNPFSATSTASVRLVGQNGTGTIDINIATNTPAGIVAPPNTITKTFVPWFRLQAIATSTKFFGASGSIVDTNSSYFPEMSGTFGTTTSIVVGPNEYLFGLATGTSKVGDGATWAASTTLSITNPVNTFSCSYKIKWSN